jgi:hypothetical protein
LAFTKSQLNKIAEAFNNQKGVTVKMSKTQVKHNKQIEGGFILSLLDAVASAVLPSLPSTIIDRIMGMGLFIKSGNGIVQLKQLGDGLYLRSQAKTLQFILSCKGHEVKSVKRQKSNCRAFQTTC